MKKKLWRTLGVAIIIGVILEIYFHGGNNIPDTSFWFYFYLILKSVLMMVGLFKVMDEAF